MKKFINAKSLCSIIICFIMIVSLCACKKSESLSSDSNISSIDSLPALPTDSAVDTSSLDDESSTDPTVESSSEDNKTPSTSSVINSSDSSSDLANSVPASSESTPTESTPTTTTPTNPEIKLASDLIVGKWRGSVDMAPLFAKEGYAVEGEMIVSCDIEFTEDGVLYETFDRVSLKAAYTALLDKAFKDEMTKNGITLEQFEASIGKNYDQYLSEYVQAAMDLVPQIITGEYRFVWSDLYVRGQDDADFVKEEYDFNGENELTLVEDGVAVTYTRIG